MRTTLFKRPLTERDVAAIRMFLMALAAKEQG